MLEPEYDFTPCLLHDASFIGSAPVLYIDNYMVRGLKREHQHLGGQRNVPLNAGIERLTAGVVVTDRPLSPAMLDYLVQMKLHDPERVLVLPVDGEAETMMLRILESAPVIERLRRESRARGIRYIDTFGISEVIGRIPSRRSHWRLCQALALPIYYNPLVADHVRQKSVARQYAQQWIDAHGMGERLFVARGLDSLTLRQSDPAAIGRFVAESNSTGIMVKKDIDTYNRGNRHLTLDELSQSPDPQDIVATIADRCPFLGPDTPFCLEDHVPHTWAPSVLVEIRPDGIAKVRSVQEQLYEGATLTGFRSPPDCEPDLLQTLETISAMIGRELYRIGYIGFAVPDFLVTADGRVCFMEINTRRGGSSVGENLAKRLGGHEPVSYVTRLIRCAPDVPWEQLADTLRPVQFRATRSGGVVIAEAARFDQTGFCTLVVMTGEGRTALTALAGETNSLVEPLLWNKA